MTLLTDLAYVTLATTDQESDTLKNINTLLILRYY